MSRPVLVSWSGGKDAALALQATRADPAFTVAGVLVTLEAATGWVAGHGVPLAVIEAQARALGLPLVVARPDGPGNDAYLAALGAALEQARQIRPGVSTLVAGDIRLADVRAWREAALAGFGWQMEFPLWGRDTARLAEEIVFGGWEALLCAVDTSRLHAGFCGRRLDAALLRELPPDVDPCGEEGEFHTCVVAGPLWPGRLPLRVTGSRLHAGRFQYLDVGIDGEGAAARMRS